MDNPTVEDFDLSYYCPICAESGLATLYFSSQEVGLLLSRTAIFSLQFGPFYCWLDFYYSYLKEFQSISLKRLEALN